MNGEQSAIIESQSLNSSVEMKAFTYMASTPEETTRKFEGQARVQKGQSDMLHAQQQSINDLKQMITFFLGRR